MAVIIIISVSEIMSSQSITLFQVSDLARSVALQEEKFIAFKDGLEHCLGRYHKVLAALSHAEVS